MTTVLVTGSSGFIGSAIVKALLQNNVDVVALVRRQSNNKDQDPTIQFRVTEDLFNETEENLAQLLEGIDIIIHAAWILPFPQVDINTQNHCVQGSINLAKAALKSNVKKFVGLGTYLEYDLSQRVLSPNSPLKPQNLYAEKKVETFLHLKNLFDHSSCKFQWFRIFNVYGENQQKHSLYGFILHAIANNRHIEINNANHVRDYLNIDHAARLIVSDALYLNDDISNICSEIPVSNQSFICSLFSKELLGFFSFNNSPESGSSWVCGIRHLRTKN